MPARRCVAVQAGLIRLTHSQIGRKKDEQDAIDNPTFKLENNVRYKKMFAGTGTDAVAADSTVDIVYSISQSRGGAYM